MRGIIDDTIKLLEELKRTGATHVEVSRETVEELGREPAGWSGGSVSRREIEAEPVQCFAEAPLQHPTSGPHALQELESRAKACVRCVELARCRTKVVFGTGNPRAELMFIGEAPGHDEDLEGEPFVGRAGELLTKIIQAMGFKRSEVYIANVLKCRPPQNRTPMPDEVTNCLPYLLSQIELIQPKVIVALGATAMKALIDVQTGITKMRGNWYTFREIPIMPTFHPAYLLRNPPAKKDVWADMQVVVERLGRKLPLR